VLQPLDKLNEAVKNYEHALNLYQQVGDRLGEANVLQTMGEVQLLHDDLDGALKYFERALVLYRQVGSKLGEAYCYQAQGNVKFEQGNYQQALTLHTSAYLLFQQLQDEYSQARLLYYRSLVYEALDEQPRALQDAEEAFIIAERLHLPYVDLFHQRVEALRR
jgi:tetratricopeptide (TPR) repeat protein